MVTLDIWHQYYGESSEAKNFLIFCLLNSNWSNYSSLSLTGNNLLINKRNANFLIHLIWVKLVQIYTTLSTTKIPDRANAWSVVSKYISVNVLSLTSTALCLCNLSSNPSGTSNLHSTSMPCCSICLQMLTKINKTLTMSASIQYQHQHAALSLGLEFCVTDGSIAAVDRWIDSPSVFKALSGWWLCNP